jgi:hypothetical protein
MAPVATIVGGRQEGELGVDPVGRDVGTGCADIEVHTIAQPRDGDRRGSNQYASGYPQNDIGHIIVGAAAVGESRRIAGQATEALLICGCSGRNRSIQPQ